VKNYHPPPFKSDLKFKKDFDIDESLVPCDEVWDVHGLETVCLVEGGPALFHSPCLL
jgi:hypothetical protein